MNQAQLQSALKNGNYPSCKELQQSGNSGLKTLSFVLFDPDGCCIGPNELLGTPQDLAADCAISGSYMARSQASNLVFISVDRRKILKNGNFPPI